MVGPVNRVTHLDELADVDVTTAPPTDGQSLTWDATNGVWVPETVSGSSPLTTKGDLYTHDGSADARLAVGSDGQVLTADAASPAGVKWATGTGSSDVTLIDEQTLASAAASIDFTSIPSSYTHLRVVGLIRSDVSGLVPTDPRIRVGGSSLDTGANYDTSRTITGDSSAGGGASNGAAGFLMGQVLAGTGAYTNAFTLIDLLIVDYTSTATYRPIRGAAASFVSASVYRRGESWGQWRNTADAIQRVQVSPLSGNLIAGSMVQLFGIG